MAKDEKKAAELYRKAADKGDTPRWPTWAILYQHGIGVDKDEKRAAELYQKAADKGEVRDDQPRSDVLDPVAVLTRTRKPPNCTGRPPTGARQRDEQPEPMYESGRGVGKDKPRLCI